MAKAIISPQAKAVIGEKLFNQGLELLDIVYCREHGGRILRLYIDSETGVDSDSCAKATWAVKDYIDSLPDLDYDYLEVSSPGIDRILSNDKDLQKFRGERVLVKTRQPVEGNKKLIGILAGTTEETVDLEIEGRNVSVSRGIITMIRLHPEI